MPNDKGWTGWTKFVDEDTELVVQDEDGNNLDILGVTYVMGGGLVVKVKVDE